MTKEGAPGGDLATNKNLEFGVAVVDAYEDLIDTARSFTLHASAFPKEIQEEIAREISLADTERQDIIAVHTIDFRIENLTAQLADKVKREFGIRLWQKIDYWLSTSEFMESWRIENEGDYSPRDLSDRIKEYLKQLKELLLK